MIMSSTVIAFNDWICCSTTDPCISLLFIGFTKTGRGMALFRTNATQSFRFCVVGLFVGS